jgi:amino acid permease
MGQEKELQYIEDGNGIPTETQNSNQAKMKRDLKPRHLQMIALGGTIGNHVSSHSFITWH